MVCDKVEGNSGERGREGRRPFCHCPTDKRVGKRKIDEIIIRQTGPHQEHRGGSRRVLQASSRGHGTQPFFPKTNMTWLRMRQVQFFTQALGGAALYKWKGMKEAHAKMTIGQHHFDLVAMHLVDTLKALSVAQAEIDAVVSAVAPLAKDIVSN